MAEPSQASGKPTTCMEEECMCGKMEGNMKVTISMIRSMDMAFTHGQMDANTLETGKTANKMVKESTSFQMELNEWDFGKAERDLDGWMKKMILMTVENEITYNLIFKDFLILLIT
jgi:hypothetical protein